MSIGNIRGLIVPGMKRKRLFWWLTVLRIFVTVLYLTLAHPENVIAVQYLPGYRDVLERERR